MSETLQPIENRRIMLVGGAGFIGHHLALRLRDLGADVSVVDGLMVNNLLALKSSALEGGDEARRSRYERMVNERLRQLRGAGVPLHVVDARDLSGLRRIIDELQPQTLVHLAAIAHAGRSNREPQAAFEHLLQTLQHSLTASTGICEHVVYFSSSMVYGNFAAESVTEDSPCEPLGVYGSLKYAGEKMLIAHEQVSGTPYTIIRPSALYGPRCISRRVIQVFIENLLQGLELNIDGDGDDRLDFTFIDDLVDGTIRTLQHPKSRNETFNLTYGSSRSINEVVRILRRWKPDLTVNLQPKPRLMPSRGTLCVEKARELIGYDPSWPIEQGIPAYIDWYTQNVDLATEHPDPIATIEPDETPRLAAGG